MLLHVPSYIVALTIIVFVIILIYTVCVYDESLEIQSNGVTTSQAQFCTGDELVFTCTLAVGGYQWVALPFLDGSVGSGSVASGESDTVGNITLSTSGTGSGRSSTLQVTAFPGLNGANILCREASGDPNINQNVTITVFGECVTVILLWSFSSSI